ncbi:hypothetical protein K503DRAFT_856536 [Rhizopogon vinicolor AM-OR11-026]|uniref:DUF7918 domain-containing protein n=1 Tax=Rhizopogon vinicolor AM-OR11-026 TaxID=1314800 RepID=A0A1B7N1E6_9AGAM|nr:hypothetical protein K503DRAFT_856536 [Rhizopogon vinicolor AM-OR11-026]
MLKYQEYTAWISVDGQPLENYAVETSQATNEVTCWIASEAGKEFSVHCQDTSITRANAIAVDVTIDGQDFGGVILDSEDTNAISMSNVQVSDTTFKPFVFLAVQLTDEDDFTDMSPAGLGEIELKLWKVALGNAILRTKYYKSEQHKVHERAKKAVTHCVGLGQETVATKLLEVVESENIGEPLAIFTFKYRDPNRLKADGIIPVPAAASLKRKASLEIIDLTAHDIKIESSRPNALVRGERNSHRMKKTENKNKKVKQEQKPGSVEVIDLT